jgi:molybdenum cofactor cytidylyltransferase
MNSNYKIGIILLAAGSSSRLGFPKQMISIGSESLLSYLSKIAMASKANEVLAVLGSGRDSFKEVFMDIPIDTTYNEDWNKGIGSSIKHGLKVILKLYPELQAIIIMLCDQPYLSSKLLNELITTHLKTSKPVVASEYDSTKGVPALFHHTFFNQLSELADDSGARGVIRQLDEKQLACIPFKRGNIDLDTEEDLRQFIQRIG